MDSDIHFGDIEEAAPKAQLRPDRNRHFAVVPVYDPTERDLPVFVDVDVLRDMEAHAHSDDSVELGGVLLGGQFEDDDGKPFVVVSDSLRAQHFESTKGSFKFTHDTWEQITRERELFPRELQMVGWYHTHPGWGVFLSGMDMFICDNFFNKPLDVALVIDPCRRDRGFFQWTNQSSTRIRRTDGFYLIGSRFRAAELQYFAAQLKDPTPMTQDSRHASLTPPYSTPVIHLASPSSVWQSLGVLGILSLQFCFLMLIAWRMLATDGDSRRPGDLAARHNEPPPASSREREATIDAKLQVLETVIRQATKAPEGVLQSLVDRTAEAQELRDSLRGQQSLSRELDGKIKELESSLADAKRQDERQKREVAELEVKVANFAAKLQESRDQLDAEKAKEKLAGSESSSWWSLLLVNSKPISVGVLLGAVAVAAVVAVVNHSKRPLLQQGSDMADER